MQYKPRKKAGREPMRSVPTTEETMELKCYRECPFAWHVGKAIQHISRNDSRRRQLWDLLDDEEKAFVRSWKGIIDHGYARNQ